MIAGDFWTHYVWPAGGGGGTPGDVFGTLEWSVLMSVLGAVIWPPLRKRVRRWVSHETATLHAKLDHVIKHHPDIPDFEEPSDRA